MNIDDLKRTLVDRERYAPDAEQVRAAVLDGTDLGARTRRWHLPLLLAAAVVTVALVATLAVVRFGSSAPPPATPPLPVTAVPTAPASTGGSAMTSIGSTQLTRPTRSESAAIQPITSRHETVGAVLPATSGPGTVEATASTGPATSVSSARDTARASKDVSADRTATSPTTSYSRGSHEPESFYQLRTRLLRLGVDGMITDHPWGGRADLQAIWEGRWIFAAQSAVDGWAPEMEHLDDIELLGMPVQVVRTSSTGVTLMFTCGQWRHELAVDEPGLQRFDAKATELEPAIELATRYLEDLDCDR